jgi:hypothetical protein
MGMALATVGARISLVDEFCGGISEHAGCKSVSSTDRPDAVLLRFPGILAALADSTALGGYIFTDMNPSGSFCDYLGLEPVRIYADQFMTLGKQRTSILLRRVARADGVRKMLDAFRSF